MSAFCGWKEQHLKKALKRWVDQDLTKLYYGLLRPYLERIKKLKPNPQVLFDSKASIRFKSGAYTTVREHFEADRNAAIGQKMRVCYEKIFDAFSISSGQKTNRHFSSGDETEP